MNEPYAVISTHTLTWSVTHGTLVQRQISNFNSHAHVERDWGGIDYVLCKKISTHTLTWSVTRAARSGKATAYISTHTLTWSVTGADAPQYLVDAISTHTLTWSVTTKGMWIYTKLINFNSHAHVERDCKNFFIE